MIHKIWAIAVAGNQETAEVAMFFPFRGRLREEDDVPRRGRGLRTGVCACGWGGAVKWGDQGWEIQRISAVGCG